MDVECNNHSRVIIHIDLDCYYAQVEMIKNPKLRDVPLGVQQKYAVVTSNYKAREYGIKKCMMVGEAKKLCPNLVLVNGEDLHDYRQMSYKVTNLMQRFTDIVERLGLDENFLDVSELVKKKLKDRAINNENIIKGHLFGDESSDRCYCGCTERLSVGSVIASEIRNCLKSELNLTSCAGIAPNKLLAKIVGSTHRPNQQTTVLPNSAHELMLSLQSVSKIPGIGQVMCKQLDSIQVKSVQDLQNVDIKQLEIVFGVDKSKIIKNWSFGEDATVVKVSGRPQSIGIEDSYQSITAEKEIRDKIEQLLHRLLILVDEDGRVPKTIKLTIRKLHKANKTSHRETRQCNVNPNLFTQRVGGKMTKIVDTLMALFNRTIDPGQPYHITLIGLSCTKFQEAPKNSIAAFLRKNQLEVQSITSIESEGNLREHCAPSTSRMIEPKTESDSSTLSTSKRPKHNLLHLPLAQTSKKRFFQDDDCASPSKLRVEDLCLDSNEGVCCPPNVDKDVFNQLPRDIQKEVWNDFKQTRENEINFCSSQVKKAKTNTLLNYFVRN